MSNELAKAFIFASKAHHGQLDKGGCVYISHPLRMIHANSELNDKTLTAMMLHDVIEDCDVSEEQLRSEFSKEVCDAVMAVTKIRGEGRDKYFERVASSKMAWTVKVADNADNSLPWRLALLDDAVAERLRRKYRKDKEDLDCIGLVNGWGGDSQ